MSKSFLSKLRYIYSTYYNVNSGLNSLSKVAIENYLQENLYNNAKYQNKLNKFEFQSFSQFGEDGIIEEIFNRVGTTNRYFVEFGVETGNETNSTYLLFKGWSGYWIDGNKKYVDSIKTNFSDLIATNRLRVACEFITAENIEHLFEKTQTPKEFDLLSIDIDRNDYHVWKAIKSYRPRVVVIEYNAIFRPGCDYIIPYESHSVWDRTSNFGASLESMYKLGLEKGYKLVACSFSGVNAFFVREDLVGDKFGNAFTPADHYEPPRYFLATKNGHPRKVQFNHSTSAIT